MTTQSKGSVLSIAALMATAIIIILAGVGFGVFALVTNATFSVMSAQIPAAVFAAVVGFLGVRYLLATLKLAKKISGERFSWNNFKRNSAKGSI
jgi:hypothetical protein